MKFFGYLDDLMNMILGWPDWAKFFIFGSIFAIIAVWYWSTYR